MEAVFCRSAVVGTFSKPCPPVYSTGFSLSMKAQRFRMQPLPPAPRPRLAIMYASSALPGSVTSPSRLPSPSEATIGIWRSAEAVCFDVDSTVCMDEGIDALGEFCGAGEAVAAWTSRAMGGSVAFEEALAARLALFKPSLKDVERFLASNPPKITPGIEELIKKLQSKGKAVYLISGGFRQMIEPVAKILRIQKENIFANSLLFDENGTYAGFDTNEPTSRSGGKAAAIAHLKQKCGYNKLVMIGDGATDLEARQPGGAEIFICYGGVQFRESVAAKSDWCVLNFRDLIESL
eukprot:c17109_g1_i1 orf=296-1174(+)